MSTCDVESIYYVATIHILEAGKFMIRKAIGCALAALTLVGPASGVGHAQADGWDYVYGDPGPQNYSRYQAVRSSATGEAYLAGFFTGSFHGLTATDVYRSFVQRIDPDGSIAWTVFADSRSYTDIPREPELLRDDLGNVYFNSNAYYWAGVGSSTWTMISPGGATREPSTPRASIGRPISVSSGGILQVPFNGLNGVERLDANLNLLWSFDVSPYFDSSGAPSLAESPDGTFWIVGTKSRTLPTQSDSISMVHLSATGEVISTIRHFGAVTRTYSGEPASSVLTVGDGYLWVRVLEQLADPSSSPAFPYARSIWSMSTSDGSKLGEIEPNLPTERVVNGSEMLECADLALKFRSDSGPAGILGWQVVMGGARLVVVANCRRVVSPNVGMVPPISTTTTPVLLTYAAEGSLGTGMRRIGARVLGSGTTFSAFDADDSGNVVVAGSTTEGAIFGAQAGVRLQSGSPERAVAARNPTGSLADLPDFEPVTPIRLFDSRPSEPQGAVVIAKQLYGPGTELRIRVTGTAGVPATGVTAVAMNITATEGQGTGFVTVYPCGSRPQASNLNFVAGQTVPNAVIAPVSPSGEICIFANAPTHLLGDLNGWFATGSSLNALTPTRLFDTRPNEPQGAIAVEKTSIGGARELRVKVTGTAGIPLSGVGTISLNVTATEALGSGFVTVYPCGTRPGASNLNFITGQTVPNAVLAPVSASGEVCFFSNAGVHLLADVNGWIPNSNSSFRALEPSRLFDTRPSEPQGSVTVDKRLYGGERELRIKVTGASGVPTSGVSAVSLNVTVTEPTGVGFVTVYPCGGRPGASNLNFITGQTVPNAVLAPVSASGEVCFFSNVGAHLLADVNGWIAA